MNNKAQNTVGTIIVVFIGVLVGLILFQAIAQTVGTSTSTSTTTEESLGTMTNGTTLYLTDYRAISDVVLINATAVGAIIEDGNYTVTNNVIDPTTGGLSVSILPHSETSSGVAWYMNATVQPTTYIANSGGRAMASLIVVFFALAIVVVAMYPILKDKILNMGI